MTTVIKPKDEKNWSPVYINKSKNSVMICGDSFGQADPYKMVIMSREQFKQLQKVKLK